MSPTVSETSGILDEPARVTSDILDEPARVPLLDHYMNTAELQHTDFYPLRGNIKLCVAVAMAWGWIPAARDCPGCGGRMRLYWNQKTKGYTDQMAWICMQDVALPQAKRKNKNQIKRTCKKEVSIREGTWLSKLHKELAYILQAIYQWSLGAEATWESISLQTTLSQKQVWTVTKACRLTAANFMHQNPELTYIGGTDAAGNSITVQVDETCCGKMKHHRGKPKPHTWVVGGVETKTETHKTSRSFALTVPKRDKATLIPVLKAKIAPESRIWTDGWASYMSLPQHYKEWGSVNHKYWFKDPNTGIHTNACEGGWNWLRKQSLMVQIEKKLRSMSSSTTSSSGPSSIHKSMSLGSLVYWEEPAKMLYSRTKEAVGTAFPTWP